MGDEREEVQKREKGSCFWFVAVAFPGTCRRGLMRDMKSYFKASHRYFGFVVGLIPEPEAFIRP